MSSCAAPGGTDASDTAQLLIFWRGVDDDMNVTEELLDLQNLEGQTRGTDLFVLVCAAVDDDVKLPWSKVSGMITDGAPAMVGDQGSLSTLICNKSMKSEVMPLNSTQLNCLNTSLDSSCLTSRLNTVM